MIVAIHQPNYIPWLGYFYKMAQGDIFVFLDHVQYTKNSFINRNRIKTPSGEMWLTVPVLSKGRFGQTINQVEINNSVSWGAKHWKSLVQNYGKATYFESYAESFKRILESSWDKLAELNIGLVQYIAETIDIGNRQFVRSSELCVTGEGDELLTNICKSLGADTYLSGVGGKKYLREEHFRESGIELRYYDFEHPVYQQLWGAFVPNLSVVDLLFNHGEESIDVLLNQEREHCLCCR